VIHVTVRVDGGVERTALHGAHGGERPSARGIGSRVDEDEASPGANGRDIGPGMKEMHAAASSSLFPVGRHKSRGGISPRQ
jgi:hypothetical protein